MAKITEDERQEFAQSAEFYKAKINESLEKEKNMLALLKSGGGVEYNKIILAEEMIYIATLYIAINGSSLKILGIKNNDALNDARKMLYKAIIYLEEVVTNSVVITYNELTEQLSAISNFPIQKRYQLMQKLGLAIQMVVDGFGDNSKWRWSFVELWGRYGVVCKNLIDLKAGLKDYFDPNSPNYETTVLYIRMMKKILDDSANSYRDKYELSTHRLDDINAGINFLIASRRISVALGNADEAEEIKKKALTWKKLMESDQKTGKSN